MSILPGATIGILGGGQLGRMTAMAARSLGYHILALDPDPSCAARFVVERCLAASFDDEFAAAVLARGSQVVTLEIEDIAIASLEAAAHYAPVRPGAGVLAVIQDRARQKQWLADHGFPVGDWRAIATAAELAAACGALGGEVFVKRTRGGYDGRGQARMGPHDDAAAVHASLGGAPCVVEKALPIASELSVLVARRPSGEVAVYPPALNEHEDRVLAWSVLPGPFPDATVRRACELARGVAEAIEVEGLLVVEMFLVAGELFINELAPRPHNSYHTSEIACVTSQFEQVVRAICDLPLGSVEIVRPAAIVNLLGDLWLGPRAPAFDAALAVEGVRVHLYGKRVARPGRKMGHLSAIGATPEEAIARVQRARTLLAV